ncbi:MAG: hypothetical protein WCL71_16895 [Deltaproteobacteria bacterium]
MKISIRLPAPLLFAACLLIGMLTTAHGIGVAVLKEQEYHSDKSANVFIYTAMNDDGGPLVGFTSQGKTYTVERSKVAGRIEILASIPYNLTNEEEMGVVRRSLKEIQDFSTKYPKSAPIFAPHVASLDKAIKNYEEGKVRNNWVWISREEFVQLQAKQQKETEDKKIQREKELADSKIRNAQSEAALKLRLEQEAQNAKSQKEKVSEADLAEVEKDPNSQGLIELIIYPGGREVNKEAYDFYVKGYNSSDPQVMMLSAAMCEKSAYNEGDKMMCQLTLQGASDRKNNLPERYTLRK